MSEIQALDVRIPAEIIHNWGWFLLFGICLVLLGALAIVRSVAATVVSMLFFGWLLLIAAGIEIVHMLTENRPISGIISFQQPGETPREMEARQDR